MIVMSIFYILLCILACIVVISAYIKIKFRFWAAQPVFHAYDFYYYLVYSGVINSELPKEGQYTNFKNIETLTFGKNVKLLNETRFLQLLNRHYLQNGENKFCPTKENVLPYFDGHNFPCCISFYNVQEVYCNAKTNEMIDSIKPIGIMTSRPVRISIHKNNSKVSCISINANYVDYLCVHKDKRKQGIAQQLIETHHYNKRRISKEIKISLFKREGQLTGIVPLCVFDMHVFPMRKWNQPTDVPPPYSIVECGASNIHFLQDFLKSENIKNKIDIKITTEIGNISALIKSKNIYVYLLIHNENRIGDVVGAYFFRKTCTYIKESEEALLCFASLYKTNDNLYDERQAVFIHGFKQAIGKICLGSHKFHYLVVEEISDNDILVRNLKQKTWPEFSIPGAYFFYNYAHSTFSAKKTLVIL